MLPPRTKTILRSIARQYIEDGTPVSSATVIEDCRLHVCSATVRNEMVRLERDGYIIRSHHSSGSIPSDKGYRYYVESLKDIELPMAEQLQINHLFHQVEMEIEEWLELAVSLIAQRVRNIAVITMPRSVACRFHHLELVYVQDSRALAVLILRRARVRQQLINFKKPLTQADLTVIAGKTNAAYGGLTRSQILLKEMGLSPEEQQVNDIIVRMMEVEDKPAHEESYLDGLHFMLEQPEFSRDLSTTALMELIEQRRLGKAIVPEELAGDRVQVVIGEENREEVIRNCSVVVSRYGLSDEAVGTIGVIGPTRMHYERAISAISYLSIVMTTLVAELYGREPPAD